MVNETLPPVLIIGYCRPELLRQKLIDVARQQRDIYVFVDGAKDEEDSMAFSTQEVLKNTLDEIRSFDAFIGRVSVLISPKNLGAKWGPLNAINWAFSSESSLIILEDDIEIFPDFFPFMDWALSSFVTDPRIFHINGFLPNQIEHLSQEAVFLSRNMFGWGWATWRHKWQNFDSEIAWYQDPSSLKNILRENLFNTNKLFLRYWVNQIKKCKSGHDAWDYQWQLSLWKNRGLAITPSRSLTKHVGTGIHSTHFKSKSPKHTNTEQISNSLIMKLVYDKWPKYYKLEYLEKNDFILERHRYGFLTRRSMAAFVLNFWGRLKTLIERTFSTGFQR